MADYDENNIDKVYEDEHVLAFNDIAPQAPVHILVIPKGAYVSMADFGSQAGAKEVAAFFKAVSHIAEEAGLQAGGFRCIANAGVDGGQEVPHFHMHILGGKRLGPMLSKAA